MQFESKHTRFRAYQLKTKGASFSYWDGATFTLGEARLNDDNISSICHELKKAKSEANHCVITLHITSWDDDHCNSKELHKILTCLTPTRIEIPGYEPHTDNGKECYSIISDYIGNNDASCLEFTKECLSQLPTATNWGCNNVCWIKGTYTNSNNNSSIQLFRSGCFTVLSLGDVESKEIANSLLTSSIMRNEVDILILPHHGADNGFITDDFLKKVSPKAAIALCDWGNQYEHPSSSITRLLRNNGIPYYSTKQGDVIIESISLHNGSFKIWNYISDGEICQNSSGYIHSKKGLFFS